MTIGAESALEARKSLDEERIRAFDKAGLTFTRLIRELKPIALSDIANYITIDEGGAIQAISLDSIKRQARAAIKKIKEKTNISESKDGETVFKTSTIEYELYDKLGAIEKVLKLRNDYPAERREITGEINYAHDLSPELADLVNAVLTNSTKAFTPKPSNGNGKKNGGKRK